MLLFIGNENNLLGVTKMQNIKLLEALLGKLDTNLDDVDFYDYEKYPGIRKFVKEYEIKNPTVVSRYLEENGRSDSEYLEELTFNDIVEIINGQIAEIQDVVKDALHLEQLKLLKENQEKYGVRK